ncbi:MAG: zinc ribbon domain-containing protein [Clostridia bacterium]|nr:zinc ribbon domain-containing protein [Clostridia bacterium]
MICSKCGKPLAENAAFCMVCGTRVEVPPKGNYQQTDNSEDYQARDVIESSSSKGSILLPIIISISAILLVFIVCLSLVLTSMFGGKLAVNIDAYPERTQAGSVVISGRASTKGSNATISINGEFVSNITANSDNQYWSKSVDLKDGSNTFVVTITDTKGNMATENVSIICDSQVVFKKGTILVKHNASGVYVRPTPQISNKYIMLIDRNDYTSRFVCLGEESTDSEGYIWCKVSTPNKGIGWVRSDLMRVLE